MSALSLPEMLKVVFRDTARYVPQYATAGAAGADVRAQLDAPVVIEPARYELIRTGLFPMVPQGYELQVRPRSGLALRHGVTVLNAPGTIDADYRGEIGVLLVNHGRSAFTVRDGDRIAQLVVARCERARFELGAIDATERGEGGFGHSGVQ